MMERKSKLVAIGLAVSLGTVSTSTVIAAPVLGQYVDATTMAFHGITGAVGKAYDLGEAIGNAAEFTEKIVELNNLRAAYPYDTIDTRSAFARSVVQDVEAQKKAAAGYR